MKNIERNVRKKKDKPKEAFLFTIKPIKLLK